MIYIATNLVPILCATCFGLLVGAGYTAVGLRGSVDRPRPLWLLPVAAIAEFWLAAILAGALILAPVQANPWAVALGTAVIIWVGFVVPVLVVSYPARGLRSSVLFLDCLHWLVVMVGQAVLLKFVGLVRP